MTKRANVAALLPGSGRHWTSGQCSRVSRPVLWHYMFRCIRPWLLSELLKRRRVEIAIPIFDGFTALDAIGPYEVLARIPGATVRFVAEEPGPKRAETRPAVLTADVAFDELPAPDIVVVPGGPAARDQPESHEALLDWLRAAHATSTWTTSVCTGSLLLGAAGILDGLQATSHWLALERLRDYGATPVSQRIVEQEAARVITCAGVSAGIDMALALTARLSNPQIAQAIQLAIEYAPQPPFQAGTPDEAPKDVVALVQLVAEKERRANA